MSLNEPHVFVRFATTRTLQGSFLPVTVGGGPSFLARKYFFDSAPFISHFQLGFRHVFVLLLQRSWTFQIELLKAAQKGLTI